MACALELVIFQYNYFTVSSGFLFLFQPKKNRDDNIFIHLQCSTRHWQLDIFRPMIYGKMSRLDTGYWQRQTKLFTLYSISFATHRIKCALNHSYSYRGAMTLRSIQWALNNQIALRSSKRRKKNETNPNHHYHFPPFHLQFYFIVLLLRRFSCSMHAYTRICLFIGWFMHMHIS